MVGLRSPSPEVEGKAERSGGLERRNAVTTLTMELMSPTPELEPETDLVEGSCSTDMNVVVKTEPESPQIFSAQPSELRLWKFEDGEMQLVSPEPESESESADEIDTGPEVIDLTTPPPPCSSQRRYAHLSSLFGTSLSTESRLIPAHHPLSGAQEAQYPAARKLSGTIYHTLSCPHEPKYPAARTPLPSGRTPLPSAPGQRQTQAQRYNTRKQKPSQRSGIRKSKPAQVPNLSLGMRTGTRSWSLRVQGFDDSPILVE